MLLVGYNSQVVYHITTAGRDNFEIAVAYVAGICALWHARHGTRYAGDYIGFGKEIQEIIISTGKTSSTNL